MKFLTIALMVGSLSAASFVTSQPLFYQSVINERLWNATRANDLFMVRQCLAHGAYINSVDKKGHTALHLAAIYGHFAIAKYLLESGAAIDLQDYEGQWTALHWAADYGYRSIVELLVIFGADVNASDAWGQTPLDWAVGHYEIMDFLAYRGALFSQKVKNLIDRNFASVHIKGLLVS